MGSLFLADGTRKSVRIDHKNPTNLGQRKSEVFLCNDVMFNVFELLDRAQLGLKLSFVSVRFNDLVETYFKSLKWTMKDLCVMPPKNKKSLGPEFLITEEKGLLVQRTETKVPIPTTALPDSFVGFGMVEICFIDVVVLSFLDSIRRLFDGEVNASVEIGRSKHCDWAAFAQRIWPMLEGCVKRLTLCAYGLAHLSELVSPSVLLNASKLCWIVSFDPTLFPYRPPSPHSTPSSVTLFEWFHTPRADGRPKVFVSWKRPRWDPKRVNFLVEAFRSATAPVNYIAFLIDGRRGHTSNEFVVQNGTTGEQLIFKCSYLKMNWKYMFMLSRCPIGRDEAQWKKWEDEVIDWMSGCEKRQQRFDVCMDDYDNDIDGSVTVKETVGLTIAAGRSGKNGKNPKKGGGEEAALSNRRSHS